MELPILPTLHNIVRRNVEWGAPVFGGDGPRRTPPEGVFLMGRSKLHPSNSDLKAAGTSYSGAIAITPELLLSLSMCMRERKMLTPLLLLTSYALDQYKNIIALLMP